MTDEAAWRQEDQRCARYSQRADELYDALQDHNRARDRLDRDFDEASQRLKEEVRQGIQQQYVYDTFMGQLSNARIVCHSAVRTYAILSWTKAILPDYLARAIDRLSQHYKEAAQLRFSMHEAEVKSWGKNQYGEDYDHDDCAEGAFCKRPEEMFVRYSSLPVLGEKDDSWSNGFCDYTYEIACPSDFIHLRASFEVRKTWLSLAPLSMRYGFNGIRGAAWNDSLDEKMHQFANRALRGLSPDLIEEAMRSEIERAKITGGKKLIRDAAARLASEAEDLAAEVQGYVDSLITRSDEIHSVFDDLVQAQGKAHAQGGIASDDEAKELLELDLKFRKHLADGAHTQAHLINHAFEDLIQEARDWKDAQEREEQERERREQYPQPLVGGTWGNLGWQAPNTMENTQEGQSTAVSYSHLPAMQAQHELEAGYPGGAVAGGGGLGEDAIGDGGGVGQVEDLQRFIYGGREDDEDEQEEDGWQGDESDAEDDNADEESAEEDLESSFGGDEDGNDDEGALDE